MMNFKWKRGSKWLLLLALPTGLGLFAREQRSWMPQVIYQAKDVREMEISPDGNVLALRQYGPSGVILIDIQRGAQRKLLTTKEQFGAVCFSPDSQQVVQIYTADKNSKFVCRMAFYDVQTGKVRRHFELSTLNDKDYLGRKLVWRAKTNQIIGLGEHCFVIDANSGKVVRQFDLTGEELHDVELSPDGTMIASVNEKNPDASFTKSGTDAEIKTIKSRGVRLWDTRNGKFLRSLDQQYQSQNVAVFSKSGNMVAADADYVSIQLWNAYSGQKVQTLMAPRKTSFEFFSASTSMQFSPTEDLLAVVGHPATIYLYNVDTGKIQRTLKSKGQVAIDSLCFSPNGNFLFTTKDNGTITRWRIR